MSWKIKQEFLEYSIGGGSKKIMKLKDFDETQYEKLISEGYGDFFEKEIEKKKSKFQERLQEEIDKKELENDQEKTEE
jgi:hypothetical protein